VHDGLLNDIGLQAIGGMVGENGPGSPSTYHRLAPGESVQL
jgi:hypothetical protein